MLECSYSFNTHKHTPFPFLIPFNFRQTPMFYQAIWFQPISPMNKNIHSYSKALVCKCDVKWLIYCNRYNSGPKCIHFLYTNFALFISLVSVTPSDSVPVVVCNVSLKLKNSRL